MGIKNVIGELQVNGSPVVTENLIENTRVISATATDTASATAAWNKENKSFDFTFGLPKGNPGTPGTSVTITNLSESTAAGGTSTITFSDGKVLNIKNGTNGSNANIAAGTGLAYATDGKTLNHSNSVTAQTTAGLYKIKYDAQGHITGTVSFSLPTKDSWNYDDKYIAKVDYEWNKQVACGSGDSGAISLGRYNIYDTQLTFDIVSTTTAAICGRLVIATQNGLIKTAAVYGDASGQLVSRLRIYQSAVSNNRSWIEIFGMFDAWSKNKIHIYAIGLNSGTVEKQYAKVTKTGTPAEPVETTSGDTKWTGTIVDAIANYVTGQNYTTATGHTHNYAASSSAGGAATTVAITNALSGNMHYIPFTTGSSGGQTVRSIGSLYLWAQSESEFYLNVGSAGKKGRLTLHSENSNSNGYTNIIPANTESTVSLTLPSTTGTLATQGWVTGLGYAAGPESSTNNAIVKFSGTNGKQIVGSGITIDNNNHIYMPDSKYFYLGSSSKYGMLRASSAGAFIIGAYDALYFRPNQKTTTNSTSTGCQLNNTALFPENTDLISLGKSTNIWADFYTKKVNIQNNGNTATLEYVPDTEALVVVFS